MFLLRILIDNGKSQVDEVSSSGDLPVHMAQLDMDILKYLIDKGADVKSQGRRFTPVHTSYLDMDILNFLIDKVADVKAQSRYLQSYLLLVLIWRITSSYGSPGLNILIYLIDKDVDVKAQDRYLKSYLSGYTKYLTDKGGDIKAQGRYLQSYLSAQREIYQFILLNLTQLFLNISLIKALMLKRKVPTKLSISSYGAFTVHKANLDMDMLKYLIDKGAYLKAQGRYLHGLVIQIGKIPNFEVLKVTITPFKHQCQII